MISEQMVALARDAYEKRMGDDPEPVFFEPLRAALEAVAPLIVEECARVADGFDDDYSRSDEIAAAIRALVKEPAQAEGGK